MTAVPILERLAAHPAAFPGALLLSGPSADALEAEARRLAARLLCPVDDPEGACDACRRTAAGSHPDLFVLAPEGVSIRIDRVRQAIAFAAGRPYEAPRRVVLAVEVEKLGLEAANALLKALEEPGDFVRWILTTCRPEMLPSTILSRCARAFVPGLSRAETVAAWNDRGFGEEDAEDLALFGCEPDADPAGRLTALRELRERVVLAVAAGLSGSDPGPLVVLADELGREEPRAAAILAEVLADAALSAAGSGERMRHRPLAGPIAEIGRRRPPEALRTAAVCASDPPPDNRRGNRRLHFESLLLQLLLAGSGQ